MMKQFCFEFEFSKMFFQIFKFDGFAPSNLKFLKFESFMVSFFDISLLNTRTFSPRNRLMLIMVDEKSLETSQTSFELNLVLSGQLSIYRMTQMTIERWEKRARRN